MAHDTDVLNAGGGSERGFPQSPLAALKGNPLLGSLPDPALSALLAQMEPVRFEPGAWLLRRGEPAQALLLIIDGEAERIGGDATGDSRIIAHDLAGQEAAGLDVYRADVRAVSMVRAWRIPKAGLARLDAAAPGLQVGLIGTLLPAEASASSPQAPGRTPAPAFVPADRTLIGWIVTLILPPALFFAARAFGIPLQGSLYAALLAMVITMWVFTLVDDFIPPLLAVVCLLFVGLGPPSIVLSSFASPSFMTLIGVFALAAMLIESGLSNRVLLWLLSRLPDRPVWRQITMLAYGLALSMGTPAGINRMVLMLPAYRDMSQGLRLQPGGQAATALFAATYGGAMLFSSALATSKAPTLTVIGLLPLHLQAHFAGLFWIGAAALSTVLLVAVHLISVRIQFPRQVSAPVSRALISDRLALLGPLSLQEKVTALAFGVFLVGSVTTSLHHVTPTAVAGSVLICLLITGVMSKAGFQKSIDWPMIVFLISMDCLIRMMDYLGLSTPLADRLGGLSVVVQGQVLNFLVLALVVVCAIRLLLPISAGMLLSAVVLLPIAQAEGINPWICVFAIAVFADVWFFRHQNSIYTVAVNGHVMSSIDERAFLRHNFVMNLARIGGVFASVPLWAWMGLA